MNIELKILDHKFYKSSLLSSGYGGAEKNLPHYATPGSCAVDLYATKDYILAPQERIKIPTGIAIHLGSGNTFGYYWENRECIRFKAVIAPRSGRGTDGLVLANTVGWIDEDYQGEIIISAWNSLHSDMDCSCCQIKIKAGDRIAQMSIVPVIVANWVIVDEFTEKTGRGDGGFGSSDK